MRATAVKRLLGLLLLLLLLLMLMLKVMMLIKRAMGGAIAQLAVDGMGRNIEVRVICVGRKHILRTLVPADGLWRAVVQMGIACSALCRLTSYMAVNIRRRP